MNQEQIPIGYFSIHSKERELTEKYVLKLQALADEMLDRIKESNKMKTTEYFPILDASKAGISATQSYITGCPNSASKRRLDSKGMVPYSVEMSKIEYPHLVGTLPKQNDFVFDVFFKMQAPFTVRFVGWPRTLQPSHFRDRTRRKIGFTRRKRPPSNLCLKNASIHL
ncbi:hypothetical protein LEP1GSC165_3698 [Leptospira santarosai str. CBC523]|nr:hypothetical protein LEP1GSC165_3698 [Leptospira santarosai str. CBC523]